MLARRRLLIASTFAAIVPSLHAAELKRWKAKPAAWPIELLALDGAPLSLKQLHGRIVLVNFWATWCEPCIAEMPSLQRLRDQLAGDGFEVLAVNYQEGPARISSFVQKMNLTLPVARDTDGSVARSYGARIFPASYLVDRDGNLRYSISGPTDWTEAKMVSTIRTLLAAPPSR